MTAITDGLLMVTFTGTFTGTLTGADRQLSKGAVNMVDCAREGAAAMQGCRQLEALLRSHPRCLPARLVPLLVCLQVPLRHLECLK